MSGGGSFKHWPDYNRQSPASNYVINPKQVSAVWGGLYSSLTELFSTETLVNGETVTAPTHTIGQGEDDICLIAYNNPAKTDRNADESRQQDLSRFILPGEFAVVIKHCCPNPDQRVMECLKFQCTHLQAAIGVEFEGENGVISISNPQNYHLRINPRSGTPMGLFGGEGDALIFIKPRFPDCFSLDLKRHFVDNIRTWLLIANTLTYFPSGNNYNGNDPLATGSVSDVKDLGDKLLAALSGDTNAKIWLDKDENKVYCAELIHVGLNLGIHYPLNKTTLGNNYDRVKKEVESGHFLKRNRNHYVRRVRLQMAAESLKPMTEYLEQPAESPKTRFDPLLAIQPFTMVDILEKYIRKTIPREQKGETVAPFQVKLIEQAKPEFLKAMKIEKMMGDSQEHQHIELLFEEFLQVVGRQHQSYQAYSSSLAPVLQKAEQFVKQMEEQEGIINAFIPPHCFLIRATNSIAGKEGQGILDWQYLGHALHESMLKKK